MAHYNLNAHYKDKTVMRLSCLYTEHSLNRPKLSAGEWKKNPIRNSKYTVIESYPDSNCWETICANYTSMRLIAKHYNDVIISTTAYQITSLTIVYSTVYSDADQRKHQSSASLAFVWGIHRGPVNSPHKWPVTRKMSPFDDVILKWNLSANYRQQE